MRACGQLRSAEGFQHALVLGRRLRVVRVDRLIVERFSHDHQQFLEGLEILPLEDIAAMILTLVNRMPE